MARRKKGKAVHGWLVLDKPAGMTSTQAVGAVRRAFDARKAGHAGTLDPLATGILAIALGEETKTVPYAVEGRKNYRFTVRWGAETDTDDAEGRTMSTSDVRPEQGAVAALLPRFIGEIMQTPPAFSAIKVDGERAYDLARAGEAVELEARPGASTLWCLSACPTPHWSVRGAMRQGTYVRACPRHGTRARRPAMSSSCRTRVGAFGEAEAVTLEALQAAAGEGEAVLHRLLLPVEAALAELAVLRVGQNDAARLAQGQPVLVRGRDAPADTGPTYATCKGHLVAVGHIDKGELHPIRVFNFSGN
jgi:tRNA pseudouridine55 synthase